MKKFLVGMILIVLLQASCTAEIDEVGVRPPDKTNGPLKGVSLSPRSFEGQDFQTFMERVDETQDVLMWAGDWIDLSKEGASATVSNLTDQYAYIPIIEVGHYSQDSGELLRPFNEGNRQIYIESTLDFITEHKPAYFGMGVEINVFAEKNPGAFEEFVPFYNDLYEKIKEISPETKVFSVFQLEKMKGLTMWELEKSQPHWDMIDRFKMDLVAFTTYPGLFYRDVSDIPDDHYSEIQAHTSKPIGFTEIGWHSAPSPAGWESSQEEQAAFINRLYDLTETLDVEVMVWSFMYDLEVFEPFDTMGLIDRDGYEKMGWDVWIK